MSKTVMKIVLLFLSAILKLCLCGRPRVYNALINTNQELLPSRAYPAVSPVIGHPVYLATSSVEIHQKKPLQSQSHQHYHEPSYGYEGQDTDPVGYDDDYDDRALQGYESEQQTLQQEVPPKPKEIAHPGRFSAQERPSQAVTARSPVSEEYRRSPTHNSNRNQPHDNYDHWFQGDDESYTQRPKRPTQSTVVPRTSTSQSPPLRSRSGPPPPTKFFNGIPLNNQPDNIPVVPPPPLPIRANS